MESVFKSAVGWLVLLAEIAGTATIGVAIVLTGYIFFRSLLPSAAQARTTEEVRLTLGRGLVLGLEFLIAADILKTILGATLEDVAILGGVIVLRTILSFSIEYELKNLGQRGLAEPPGGTKGDRQL